MKMKRISPAKSVKAMKRLQTGTYSDVMEKLQYSWYDTIDLDSAVTENIMFVIPQGSRNPAGGVKTANYTNVKAAGLVPQGQSFLIKAIRCSYLKQPEVALDTTTLQNFYDLLYNTVLKVKISGKDSIYEAPLNEVMGISQCVEFVPTVPGDNVPFNLPNFKGLLPFNIPIELSSLTSWEITLTHHTGVSAALNEDKIRIMLIGALERLA